MSATARHAGALATTVALRACSANTVDHRANEVPPTGNTTGWPATMLGPGDVQVLQQDSPRHPIDGQVMHDQRQLTRIAAPTAR